MKETFFRILFALQIHRLLHFGLRRKVLILTYHGFTNRNHAGLENHDDKHLPIETFEKQLEYLKKNYSPISLEEWLEARSNGRNLPPNPVILTFDDGYKSNYTLAFPLLKRLQIPTAIFLATDWIENQEFLWTDRLEYAIGHAETEKSNHENYLQNLKREIKSSPQESREKKIEILESRFDSKLNADPEPPEIYRPLSWAEIKEMLASGLVSIGSHTCSHVILSQCTPETLRKELLDSKKLIEERTGQTCPLFCYPNGRREDFNREAKAALQESGYECALTTVEGFNDDGSDPFELKRMGVRNGMDLAEFVMTLCGVKKWVSDVKRRFQILKSSTKSVLVLDAETDQAVAVLRSLAKKKIPVDIAGSTRGGPAFWSLRAKKRFVYPSPVSHPQEFVSFLGRLLAENKYEAVFPLSDSTLTALSSTGGYAKISDKFFLFDLAREHGLAVPETFYPQSLAELKALAGRLTFPLIFKPRYSRYYDAEKNRLVVGNTQFILDQKQLEAAFEKYRQGKFFPCLQQWVEGTGFGVDVLIKGGKLLAAFCHERIRETDPLGSGSSACQSVPLREDLVEATVAMLQQCGFEGAAMAEFRIDAKKNQTWFMEINGRFWGSLALPVACGIDFPYLYFQAFFRNQTFSLQNQYRTDVQARSLWKETSRLISCLRPKPKNWKGPFPSFGEALADYWISFFKPYVYFDFEIVDPFPAVAGIISLIFKTLFAFFK